MCADTVTRAVVAVAGAATIGTRSGFINTESLTTAAGATYTLTVTNSSTYKAGDMVFCQVYKAGSAGTPVITTVDTSGSTFVIVIQNIHASDAFSGVLVVYYYVLNIESVSS